jgi:hypothetical protein
MPDFIEDYLSLTRDTKPPLEFHVWCMLGLLSIFAGRRFWFRNGHLKFDTKLYIVLVGDPGTGKSTASDFVKNMLRECKLVPMSATQITKEALTQKMSSTFEGKLKKTPFEGQKFFDYQGQKVEYNQYAIVSDELVEFIAPNPQGMMDFLTNAWGADIIDVETKNKGSDFIANPYITLLACMTPQKMKGLMKFSILTGGMARRTAWIFSSTSNWIPWAKKPNQEIVQRILAYGHKLQNYCGEFVCSTETAAFYEAWDKDNHQTLKDKHPNVRTWFESKAEMLWKISMLAALATLDFDNPSYVIELPHYRLALRWCELLENNLQRVFDGAGINPNSGAISQVIHMLEEMNEPMNRKHLVAMFMDNVTNLREFEDSLGHLVACGRLEQRDLFSGTTLIGTVIGTPGAIAKYSNQELAAFVVKKAVVAPQLGTDSGPSSTSHPTSSPDSPPEDSSAGSTPTPP